VEAVRRALRWLPIPVAVVLAVGGWVVFGVLDAGSTGHIEGDSYEAGGLVLALDQAERLAGHDMTSQEGASALDDLEVIEGTEAAVEVVDNSFDAENIQVAAGTNVVWSNRGRNVHDIIPIADNSDWGVGPDSFGPGGVYEHIFDEPGTHRYTCSLHPGMTGAVVVEDTGAFSMPQSMTPGMQDVDEDRIHVEVVLNNPTGSAKPNELDDFHLVSRSGGRWGLNEDVRMPAMLASGYSVELDLYFDVALDAEDPSLEWSRSGEVVEIPMVLNETPGQDHGHESGESAHAPVEIRGP
jgi:plastocyanin